MWYLMLKKKLFQKQNAKYIVLCLNTYLEASRLKDIVDKYTRKRFKREIAVQIMKM